MSLNSIKALHIKTGCLLLPYWLETDENDLKREKEHSW